MKHKFIKYTIEVTEDDIKQGQISNCERCPVALALHRTFKKNVLVNLFRWYFQESVISHDGLIVLSYALPDEATKFIYRFDNKQQPIAPFSFEVEIRQ